MKHFVTFFKLLQPYPCHPFVVCYIDQVTMVFYLFFLWGGGGAWGSGGGGVSSNQTDLNNKLLDRPQCDERLLKC